MIETLTPVAVAAIDPQVQALMKSEAYIFRLQETLNWLSSMEFSQEKILALFKERPFADFVDKYKKFTMSPLSHFIIAAKLDVFIALGFKESEVLGLVSTLPGFEAILAKSAEMRKIRSNNS